MKANEKWIALLILAIALLGAACGGDDAPEPTEPAPTARPAATQEPTESAPAQVRIGKAQVGSIEIYILESFPVQVSVLARGNLPDGCTRIGEITTGSDMSTNTLWVEIATVRQAEALCTAAVVPFEENVALDVYGLPAGTYIVDVNGVTDTFTLAVDNVPQTGDIPPDQVGDSELVAGAFVTETFGEMGISFTRPENWTLERQPDLYGLVPPDRALHTAPYIISFGYVPGIPIRNYNALVQAMTAHLEEQGESDFTFELDSFGGTDGIMVYGLQNACWMVIVPGGGSVRTVTVSLEACDENGAITNQAVKDILDSVRAFEPTQ